MSDEQEEYEGYDLLLVIDSQCSLLLSVMDIDEDVYNDLQEDKIKCMTNAFKVINQANANLLKLLKEDSLNLKNK